MSTPMHRTQQAWNSPPRACVMHGARPHCGPAAPPPHLMPMSDPVSSALLRARPYMPPPRELGWCSPCQHACQLSAAASQSPRRTRWRHLCITAAVAADGSGGGSGADRAGCRRRALPPAPGPATPPHISVRKVAPAPHTATAAVQYLPPSCMAQMHWHQSRGGISRGGAARTRRPGCRPFQGSGCGGGRARS